MAGGHREIQGVLMTDDTTLRISYRDPRIAKL
jgi:hypothetical protein